MENGNGRWQSGSRTRRKDEHEHERKVTDKVSDKVFDKVHEDLGGFENTRAESASGPRMWAAQAMRDPRWPKVFEQRACRVNSRVINQLTPPSSNWCYGVCCGS
jgi:hypothetical protein